MEAREAEPDTIDLTGGKKKGKTKSKQPKVDREKTENKSRGNKKRKERDAERRTNDFKGEGDNAPAPQSAVQEAARAFHAACKATSMESARRSVADGLPATWWHEITQHEVSEMMARIPAETAAKIAGSASHKGNFYAVLDRENMCRSGVYPNWLNAEHVKKSASGYGKYGTKQDCIEGALEELETMIEHYNHNCKAKMGSKMY